jgi:hypothetical protein
MQAPKILSIILFAGTLYAGRACAQTLNYDWLNVPCIDNLNCWNGCSACNLPADAPANFFGTNVLWEGMDVCPHPITIANNAVYTTGWPIEPQSGVFVGLSTATLGDVHIDSVVIRHRRSADGPQRLRVQFSNDVMQAPTLLGDVDVTQTYEETVFTDLGCLNANPGSEFRGFVLRMQAYQGGAGDWQIDAMRIVTTPCAAQVGIAENFQRDLEEGTRQYVDVLGRPIQGQPAPGLYIGGRKRVQVL